MIFVLMLIFILLTPPAMCRLLISRLTLDSQPRLDLASFLLTRRNSNLSALFHHQSGVCLIILNYNFCGHRVRVFFYIDAHIYFSLELCVRSVVQRFSNESTRLFLERCYIALKFTSSCVVSLTNYHRYKYIFPSVDYVQI